MLAAIVLVAQVSTAATPNPCADQLATLCRVSPLFCPTAYPSNMVPGTNGIPCWPDRQVAPVAHGAPTPPTRDVGLRGSGSNGTTATRVSAAPNGPPVTQRSFFSALSKLMRLSAD
jgi:hypothetical protein